MQPACSDILAAPWAILPARLPFILAALMSTAYGQRPTLRARAASTNTERNRGAGSSAIVVLPLHGVSLQRAGARGEALGFVSLWRFTQTFRAALADDSVGGILLDVDSPGGSVYGIAELAEEIYRARTRKPIAAIANSLAGSGAYWIASAASEFFVTSGGEVGSIGVVAAHQDVSKSLERAGISTTLIKAGKYKTEGSPFEPLGADGRQHMQSRVNEYHRMFVDAVAKHRGVTASMVNQGYGQGRVLDAQTAKVEGMVDDVATLDDVVRRLTQCIGQGKTARSSTHVPLVQGRQRIGDTSIRGPSSGIRRPAGLAAVRRREIELLSL